MLPTVSTAGRCSTGCDGSFRALVAVGSEGITFPSLHAALAVILIFALADSKLRWVIWGSTP